MTESLFDRVRSSCAVVADTATHVRINHEVIEAYAAAIPVAEAQAAAAADRVTEATPASDQAGVIALVLATAGVSFTSGWHDIMRKRSGMSGAVSTVARLADYVAATGALTPTRLQAITPTDASQIFEQELDGGALEELLEMLAATLNELGHLAADHGGFVQLVAGAGRSADRLATTLACMSSWNDVADYHRPDANAINVAFYKRAQMAIASLHRTFCGDGPGAFTDLDRLTIFADNLVPHVLRVDGVLTYDPLLLETIDRGELLAAGSAAEIEIRACGVHAAELIAAAVQPSITPADLDHWLWNRGAAPLYKASPRHRCRNPFY